MDEGKRKEIKILHTGDTHLGSRQYHSDIRRQDFFDAFSKVIEDAVSLEVNAVIHTGDLFDSRNPTIEDLLETISALTILKTAGIPFLGIVGNHEGKQNTQWLDIFERMNLAKRLTHEAVCIENDLVSIQFYGIDNLSAARFSSFDFSIFPQFVESGDKKIYNVLVLHQLLDPFLPKQPLSLDHFTNNISIPFDVILIGDSHKYECKKHNDSWVTYAGSTERCSAAEEDPRYYNILTFDEKEPVIVRRKIQTRDFVTIRFDFEEESPDRIYTSIDAYTEKIKDAVVLVELSGTKKALISISDIEDYVKRKGAVVVRVGDKRDLEKNEEKNYDKIIFKDPDEVVSQELRKLNLTNAGVMLDGIIRDSETAKSRIDEESEKYLKEFLEQMDFKEEIRRADVLLEKSLEIESDSAEIILQLQEKRKGEARKGEEQEVKAEEEKKEKRIGKMEEEAKKEEQDIEKEEVTKKEKRDETKDEKIKKDDHDIKKEEKKAPKIPHQYTLGDRFGGDQK